MLPRVGVMLRNFNSFWLVLGLAVACGGSGSSPQADAGPVRDAGPMAPLPSCEPTPERCEGLSEARPQRLSEHTAVYDQQRLEMIVFGGTATIPMACAVGGPVAFESETWIYDDPGNRWRKVEGESPSASGRHMAAFGNGQMWLFGGRYREPDATGSYAIYDDLFRFDREALKWRGVAIEGERPAARVNGTLTWDSKRKRLWLFGGNDSADGARYGPLNDVWSFDPDTRKWTEHEVEGRIPEARLFHAALYDAQRDALVFYGGSDESAFTTARYFGDLYTLSLSDLRFVRSHPGGPSAPPHRFWAQLVYDAARDRYLLFGGHDDQELGNRNDLWSFDPEARSWRQLQEGDTWQKPANGLCDFPPDFSAIDDRMPERRNAHTLVYSTACEHALLFGGKTDCGSTDDLWLLSGDGFEQRLEATEGEVCLRWREQGDECGDLCF